MRYWTWSCGGVCQDAEAIINRSAQLWAYVCTGLSLNSDTPDMQTDTNIYFCFYLRLMPLSLFLFVCSPFFSVWSWPPAGFRRSFRLSRRDKKTNKSMYECKKSEMYDMADVPTYEEVAPYRRLSGARHRLVVLVGESKNTHHEEAVLWSSGLAAYLTLCFTVKLGFTDFNKDYRKDSELSSFTLQQPPNLEMTFPMRGLTRSHPGAPNWNF